MAVQRGCVRNVCMIYGLCGLMRGLNQHYLSYGLMDCVACLSGSCVEIIWGLFTSGPHKGVGSIPTLKHRIRKLRYIHEIYICM